MLKKPFLPLRLNPCAVVALQQIVTHTEQLALQHVLPVLGSQ